VSFGQVLGREYTQCVQVDPLLASKTTGVDDEQLYFHVDQHTHVGVPQKACLPNGTVGIIPNWLRPVNNYKIIIIQSQHWIHLKRMRDGKKERTKEGRKEGENER